MAKITIEDVMTVIGWFVIAFALYAFIRLAWRN